MKVIFTTGIVGNNVCFKPKREYDLPKEEAKQYVTQGVARLAPTPKPIKTATLQPNREA